MLRRSSEPKRYGGAARLPRWPRCSSDGWLRFEIEKFETADLEEYEVLAYDLLLPDGARLLIGRGMCATAVPVFRKCIGPTWSNGSTEYRGAKRRQGSV